MGELNFRKLWEQYRQDFSALVQIPSVYDESSIAPDAPYGRPVREALEYMKGLCDEAGFETRVYDNAALSASWGCGERIDIVSHLDVVNVTDDWDGDPFSGSVRGGFVHGRGTQDMKSGAFLTFLAMKLAKESGIVPKREIRLVYGSDEERTMEDMRRYVQTSGLPAFAFTPDGTFPMINGEKGALMWEIHGASPSSVVSLHAGIQPNVIAPYAEAVIRYVNRNDVEAAAENTGISAYIAECEDGILVRTDGKAAHASRPEEGHSAVSDLLQILSAVTGDGLLGRLAAFFRDGYASGTDVACDIEPMGRLTMNLGVLDFEHGKLTALIDCRYPYGISSAVLTDKVRAAFPEMSVELPYDDPPTYTPADDPYISLLCEAYTEVTGKKCVPGISGGVSYSKVFGHSVTFGTVGENSEHTMHQKNEKISETDCIAALEIFYRTIVKLAEAEI